MGDFNLLNVFFDADNFLNKSDMEDFPFPSKENCELEEEPAEWFTEDALDQMLPLLDKFFSNCDENVVNFAMPKHNSDDGGLLKVEFPLNEKLTINAQLMENVSPVDTTFQSMSKLQKEDISNSGSDFSTSDETFFNAVDYVREEVIEFEEISVSSSPQSDVSVLFSDDSSDADECDYFTKNEITSDCAFEKLKVVYPKHPSPYQKSLTSCPSKKIKLTQKLDGKNERRRGNKCNDNVNFSHPRLQLTSEETKVAFKEGIELPTHYPLTKEQQRQLKRIRRKIRNKVSAQHSRRRKQEYVDSLEEKLKHNSEEKVRLMDRLKNLEKEKSSLATKIKQLQAALARCSGQMAQPTSCLLVLIMSLALILAPSLKNSSLLDEGVGDKDISMFDGQSSSLLNSGRSSSRNLLFSHNSSENQNDGKEELKMIHDLFEKIHFPNSNVLFKYLDILKIKANEDSSWINRKHFKVRKHENLEIDEDDPQATSKIMKKEELLPTENDDLKNETKVQTPITVNWRVG